MALYPSLQLIRFPPQALSSSSLHLLISDLGSVSRFFRSPWLSSLPPSRKCRMILSSRTKCFSMSTEEDQWSESEALMSDVDEGGDREDDIGVQQESSVVSAASAQRISSSSPSDYLSLAIRESVYEVCCFDAFCFVFIFYVNWYVFAASFNSPGNLFLVFVFLLLD